MASVQVEQTFWDQGLHNAALLYFDNKHKEALDICANLLTANPKNVKANYLAGLCLLALNYSDDALTGFARAAEDFPKVPEYFDALGMAFQHQGRWTEALAAYKRSYALAPAPWRESNVLWGALHHPKTSARDLFRAQREYASHWRTPHVKVRRNKDPHRKLKIGYISADLRHHSMQSIFGPVYFNHDHDQFEIHVFSGVNEIDVHTELYRLAADYWYDARAIDDKAMANEINKLEIDILVDLSGHSGANRLHVMTRKPAPVQVSAWGFAIGTGIQEMDYLFTDPIATPPGDFIHETPWYLPNIVAFNPPRDADDVSPLPYDTNKFITFGYCGRATKATDEVIRVWGRLMREVPNSRIFLKDWTYKDPPCQRRVRTILNEEGIESSRIDFRWNPRDRAGHLKTAENFDIALDPWHVNGGATTLETSWMGVPTLTIRGDRTSSRLGASILTALGHEEFIASSIDDMIAKAVDFSGRTDHLRSVRASLRETMRRSVLCDAQSYCNSVESAYREMWKLYVGA